MSGVILIVDELLDQGVIMHLDPNTIIARINTKGKSGHGTNAAAGSSGESG